ncbi:MAG: hypothetical protein WD100_08095, partial [Tistlia sp.]
MLDRLQRQHEVEGAADLDQLGRRRLAVVDRQALRLGVRAGDGDRRRRGVQAGDRGAEPGQGLGDEAAA